jgi:hypothetical protein
MTSIQVGLGDFRAEGKGHRPEDPEVGRVATEIVGDHVKAPKENFR